MCSCGSEPDTKAQKIKKLENTYAGYEILKVKECLNADN